MPRSPGADGPAGATRRTAPGTCGADWFVYVLLNAANVAYTGIAKDVEGRLARHNAGAGARFTRGRGPWRVVHVEGPMARDAALRRELAIKRDRRFKAALKAKAG